VTELWEHLSCEKRLRGLGLFRLEKARGYPSNSHKHLKGRQAEDGARLFSGDQCQNKRQ